MTTNDISCLDGVIGLANCACPCREATAPEGFTESSSGLYLADLIPFNMADAGADCQNPTNAWNVLEKGRRMGYAMFLHDFRSRLSKRGKPRRENVRNARIGEEKARDVLTISKAYAGVHIPAAFNRGGYLNIKAIGGVFDAVGTTVVNIYNDKNVKVAGPFTITTTAPGEWAQTPVNVSLPLWQENGTLANYWIAYPVNQSNLPRAVRVWCPCSNVSLLNYNMDNPYWKNSNMRNPWTGWIMIGAWQGDTLTDFDTATCVSSSSGYTNGLTLEIGLSCDGASVLCEGGTDYSDPAAMAAAYAAYYASGINVGEIIASNMEPFRNSAVTGEFLKAAIPVWWERYEENLEYAVYNADLRGTDCLIWKPAMSISVKGKTP